MKNLKTLFNCGIDAFITGISINSKDVKNGNLFVARKGVNSDGHDFIDEAIKNGAAAVVISKNVNCSVPKIVVDHVNDTIPDIMDWYYDDVINNFDNIIGVTGTAGKTTTCFIIYKVLKEYYKTIYFGSIGIRTNDYEKTKFDVALTTYSITKLYNELDKSYKNGVKNVILEASSEGLKQNRTGNIKYDIALITNLSKAHMNAHKTMDDYIESKVKLFNNLNEDGIAILNIDDEYYELFNQIVKGNKITYGKNINADIRFDNVDSDLNGTIFDLYYQNAKYEITTNLIGEYNVYNVCAAITCLIMLNINIEDIISCLNDIFVSGRMNVLKTNTDFNVVADIGITITGLKNNLLYLNKIKKGKIITVIGMSGNDSNYNELNEIGKIATDYSDYAIYTTNRNDDKSIINQLIKTISKNNYEEIYDRKKAIEKALDMAKKDDIVFISGSESYVFVNDEEYVNTKEIVENYKKTM